MLLALQLAEMEVPLVVALNMWDEAGSRGLRIDAQGVSEELGVEAVPTVAIRGEGLPALREALLRPRHGRTRLVYPPVVESAVATLIPLLPARPVAPRAMALLALTGDRAFLDDLGRDMEEGEIRAARAAIARAEAECGEPLAAVVNQTRMRRACEIAARVAYRAEPDAASVRRAAARLETLATHPVWGLPVLALVLFLAYEFVGVLGAGTLVDWLENGVFNSWINPAVTSFFNAYVPWAVVRDLVVGPYGILTMALTYSLALVLPIVGTFFIAFGVLEDSGYLPRLAVMVNRLFKKMGLNGKAVLPWSWAWVATRWRP
jgi:ferrous iron transport protein B